MSNRLKIFLPFTLLILFILVVPLLVMLVASFQNSAGDFSLTNYHQLLTNHYYHRAIDNSLVMSIVTAAGSLVVATIGAWALTRLAKPTQNVLVTVFNMASSFAGIPLAFSLVILFGNAGVWHAIETAWHLSGHFNLYSLPGTMFAFTFFEIPLGIMFLFPVFAALDPHWQEASSVLGASNWFFARRVLLPTVLPNVIQVFTLLFANAMGTYETTYALTGANIVTIPILIGSLIDGGLTANIPLACTFATLFTIVMSLIVWAGNWLTKPKEGRLS